MKIIQMNVFTDCRDMNTFLEDIPADDVVYIKTIMTHTSILYTVIYKTLKQE